MVLDGPNRYEESFCDLSVAVPTRSEGGYFALTWSGGTVSLASVIAGVRAPSHWEVALLSRTRLEQLGATVILTRKDNDGWGPCITERAATGNRARAGVVISIHADGGPPDGRGFHVIYPKKLTGLTDDIAVASLRLARTLHAAYSSIGMPVADYIIEDGYSERDDLGGPLLDVPVVFLEPGNMRHTVDADLLTDPTFQDRIAEAITWALVAFFNEWMPSTLLGIGSPWPLPGPALRLGHCRLRGPTGSGDQGIRADRDRIGLAIRSLVCLSPSAFAAARSRVLVKGCIRGGNVGPICDRGIDPFEVPERGPGEFFDHPVLGA